MASKMRGAILIMFFGFGGIILAYIEKTLYDNGTLVTALSNMGVTLTELMAITIILWILVGVIVGLLAG